MFSFIYQNPIMQDKSPNNNLFNFDKFLDQFIRAFFLQQGVVHVSTHQNYTLSGFNFKTCNSNCSPKLTCLMEV